MFRADRYVQNLSAPLLAVHVCLQTAANILKIELVFIDWNISVNRNQ